MPLVPTASGGPVNEDAERFRREKKGEKALAEAQYKGGQNAKEVRREEEVRKADVAEAKKLARLEKGVKQMTISPSRKEKKTEKEKEEEAVGTDLGEALQKFGV